MAAQEKPIRNSFIVGLRIMFDHPRSLHTELIMVGKNMGTENELKHMLFIKHLRKEDEEKSGPRKQQRLKTIILL